MTIKEMIDNGVTITSSLLENEIRKYSQKYYEGKEEISDSEFDELVDLLKKLDPESEVLKLIGWGFDINSVPGDKVEHKYQLIGSLEKAREISQIRKSTIFTEYIISAKLDGLSGVAYFTDGKLVKAVTRGNGKIGIDVTDKFRVISKSDLRDDSFSGAIRGEFVIRNKDWDKIRENNPDAKSRRNYAAGIINRNEISNDLSYLSFIPYNIIGAEDNYCFISDMDSIFDWLSRKFDECVPHSYYISDVPNISSLESYYNVFKEEFPIDGLVITNMYPEYDLESRAIIYDQIAFKGFGEQTAIVEVTNVKWNLTKSSRIVPVVEIEPVYLDECTISNITAYNAKYILDNKIKRGSVIKITRSGNVIPKILEVIRS